VAHVTASISAKNTKGSKNAKAQREEITDRPACEPSTRTSSPIFARFGIFVTFALV
jgi:hypothetical protein